MMSSLQSNYQTLRTIGGGSVPLRQPPSQQSSANAMCKNCKFARNIDAEYQCFFNPPVPVVFNGVTASLRPTVKETDFCHEFIAQN